MGQKVHPIGLRVGLYRKWKSNWFLDKNNYTNFLHLNFEINKYFAGILRNYPIKTFFSHCVIAKYSLEKIYIFIFFYRLRQKKNQRKKTRVFKTSKSFYKSNILAPNFLLKQNNLKILQLLQVFKDIKLLTKFNKLDNNINYQNNIKNLSSNKIDLNENNFELKRGDYKSVSTVRGSLTNFLGTQINITFINLLSFIKFYLINLNKPQLINGIERQMVNFFKYDVKLVRDAVNIFFITIILKQPQTLAYFISYQLRRTPRNRRHTKLIQFYKKLATLAMAQQDELIGLQIRFTGRVNGRKRKRYVAIKLGELPLQTYNKCIEYGQANAITVYGAIGVKVWIYYDKTFNIQLQEQLLKYFYYSKTKKI
jgi:ribosomal protein S3